MRSFLLIIIFLLICINAFSQQAIPLDDEQQEEVEMLEERVTYYRNNGEFKNAVANLSKIAFIYWDNQRLDKAISYFLETIPLYKELDDDFNVQKVYSNIGLIYLDMEDLVNARSYFSRSLEIRRNIGSNRLIATGLVDLAYVVNAYGETQRAIDYLLEAMEISLEFNYETLLLSIYSQLARNYDDLGLIAKSDEFRQKYQTHQSYMATSNIKEDFQIREEQTQAEIRQTQLEKRAQELEWKVQQLIYQEQQDSIKIIVQAQEDSLLQAQRLNQIREQSIQILEQEKELQKTQLEQQKERERTQKMIIYYGIAVLIVVALMLIVVFWNYFAKKRANKKLAIINKEIESKSKQLQEAYYKIEDQNLKITHSINYAKGIQRALLPPQNVLKKYIPESFIFFRPLHTVSGDFYWFKEIENSKEKANRDSIFGDKISSNNSNESINKDDFLPIKNDKFIISAVDCTGHGVPGAFMSMIGYNLLDEITYHGITESDKILKELHEGIRKTLKQEEGTNRDGMDLSLCVINKKEKTLEFSGAQNPIVYIQDGEVNVIKGDRMSIGGKQKELDRNFSKVTINVDKPTWFYIFSDGYADQFGGPKNRKFLLKNLVGMLEEIHKEPMETQMEIIEETFCEWKKDEDQIDDILVIGFKLGGNGADK
ncbi:MAG: SpoIIE family protein phosphatase [Bacteroidota bacterium]